MRALRSWPVVLGALALAGLPAASAAQAVGEEFQVNTYTTGFQYATSGRAVAADPRGSFVVVWRSPWQDGNWFGVFGQRFRADGAAAGDEFQVNTYTRNDQSDASVASDASGNFVVAWQSWQQDGSASGIFGQRFDSQGVAQGGEFRVNSHTTDSQQAASVASDMSGNFVVVWQSLQQDGSDDGIFGQRFDSQGVAQGSEFRVNSYTTGFQEAPSVASDASGNFVVVWQSRQRGGSGHAIFGQRFDSQGAAQGSEFRVDSDSGTDQGSPSVARDANGNFVVVWFSRYLGYSQRHSIHGQRYDSEGETRGDAFTVHEGFPAYDPSVASDADGNFVVVWQGTDYDSGPGAGSEGVLAQRYDNAGARLGSEFLVNSYTTSAQAGASVAADASGRFVVAWSGLGGGDAQYDDGVFGRRFELAGLPSLSIADASVKEGNLPGRASRNWAAFKVTLSAPSAETVTLEYATADGSAEAASDYVTKTGTLTLSPGRTSALIVVRVMEDNLHENDETFFVNLSNPTNATIGDGQGVGTILNDDP